MEKCKNIVCKNETRGKNIYCSLSCRNYYVNKFIRDYTKNGESIKNKYRNNYVPKICLNPNCNQEIPFERKRNKYCSNSCAAKISNIGKVLTSITKNKMSLTHSLKYVETSINCKNCENKIPTKLRIKYCSDNCRNKYRRKDMSEYIKYKQDSLFNINLNDFPNEFDF